MEITIKSLHNIGSLVCNLKNNLVFEPLEAVDVMKQRYVTSDNPLGVDRKTARSMIHPQYADRFIREYILDEEIWRGKQ